MGKKLVTIRQMAARSGVTTGTFYCGRSNGSLDLEWVKLDNGVFATEDSFLKWLERRKQRLAAQETRAERIERRMASRG